MTTKTKRRIEIGLAMLLAGGFLALGWLHYQAKHTLEDYLGQLHKRGDILTVGELAPRSGSTQENAAASLSRATWRLRGGWPPNVNSVTLMKIVSPGRARAAWRTDPLPVDSASGFSWAKLTDEVSENRESLAEIRSAVALPKLNMDLDYQQGWDLLLPHLNEVRSAARWLLRALLVDLRAGDSKSAEANLHALLLLTRLQEQEPLVISQLLRAYGLGQ